MGYLGFGKLIDRVGARLGYAAAVVVWTIAHIAHALVTTLGGFIAARLVLGLGEAGNFPAGLKAIAECARARGHPCNCRRGWRRAVRLGACLT